MPLPNAKIKQRYGDQNINSIHFPQWLQIQIFKTQNLGSAPQTDKYEKIFNENYQNGVFNRQFVCDGYSGSECMSVHQCSGGECKIARQVQWPQVQQRATENTRASVGCCGSPCTVHEKLHTQEMENQKHAA